MYTCLGKAKVSGWYGWSGTSTAGMVVAILLSISIVHVHELTTTISSLISDHYQTSYIRLIKSGPAKTGPAGPLATAMVLASI